MKRGIHIPFVAPVIIILVIVAKKQKKKESVKLHQYMMYDIPSGPVLHVDSKFAVRISNFSPHEVLQPDLYYTDSPIIKVPTVKITRYNIV